MRRLLCVWMLILCATLSQAKQRRGSKPTLTPISPSKESLIRQNLVVDQMAIPRIQTDEELQSLVEAGTLEALPITCAVTIAPSLPANRRYALPITNAFLLTLGRAYRGKFGKPLVIDSAVRPRDVQERLRHTNYAAAPADGETASSHESGLTVDFSKRMTGAQLRWMRSMLIMYQATNVVIAEEERRCFHVEVIGGTE